MNVPPLCAQVCGKTFRFLFTLKGDPVLSVLDLGQRRNVVLVATTGKRLQGLRGLEEMCSMEMLKRDSQSAI